MRIAKCVDRDGYVAYTILPCDLPAEYAKDKKFVPDESVYDESELLGQVAAERASDEAMRRMLRAADVDTAIVALPDELADGIVTDMLSATSCGTAIRAIQQPSRIVDASYLNADFHVTYISHLDIDAVGTRTLDVEGLPLRYGWFCLADKKPIVFDVASIERSQEPGLQRDAARFFQVVAIMREEKANDPEGFRRFVESLR